MEKRTLKLIMFTEIFKRRLQELQVSFMGKRRSAYFCSKLNRLGLYTRKCSFKCCYLFRRTEIYVQNFIRFSFVWGFFTCFNKTEVISICIKIVYTYLPSTFTVLLSRYYSKRSVNNGTLTVLKCVDVEL